MSNPTDFSPLSDEKKKLWDSAPMPQIGIEDRPGIFEKLLKMKYQCLDAGMKEPFTVVMTKGRLNQLKNEAKATGCVFELPEEIARYIVHDMKIEVAAAHTPMRRFALVDLTYGIAIEAAS